MAHIGIFLPGDGNLKQLLISLIGDVVFGEFHLDGNGVYQDPAGNRCCFPTKVRHLGWARGEELVAQSCALSVRELPPLQSGHRMLMSAINPAFGAVGITSMRKDAFRGLHASVPTV